MEEKDTKIVDEKTTTQKRKPAQKSTNTKQNEDLKQQLEQSEKEKLEMMEMMKSLQEQINNMKNQQPQIIIPREGENDREIEVGCRLFCGAVLSSANGEVEVRLKCGEVTEITIREMQSLLRSGFGYKKLFEKGVLYFEDPEMYNQFKIRNPLDLSEEVLIEHLLDEDYNQMVAYLSKITNDRHDDMVCHTVNYNTALLYKAGKLKDWSYANRSNFESYMGVKVDDVVSKIDDIAKRTDLI